MSKDQTEGEYIAEMTAIVDYEISKMSDSEVNTRLKIFKKKEYRTELFKRFFSAFIAPEGHFCLIRSPNGTLKSYEIKTALGIDTKINLPIMIMNVLIKKLERINIEGEVIGGSIAWSGIYISKRNLSPFLEIEPMNISTPASSKTEIG